MSNFYTEGKATEHPDISGQTEFQSIADKILEKRKKERSILPKKRGVQLPSFVGKVVNKEEVEIGEDYKKLPRERMRDQYDRKKDKNYDEYHSTKSNKNSMYGITRGESDTQIDVHGNSKQTKKIGGWLKNNPSFYEKDHENYSRSASRINQNKFDNNIKILEAHYNPTTGKIQAEKPSEEEINTLAKKAAASGPKKRKPVGSVRKNSATFKPSSPEQAKADMKSWSSYWGGNEEVENSYECVIEALVEYGFAEDDETANDMIIGLSEGFIGMIFEEYLEEKARGTRKKTTSHMYDMDETLFGHDHSKVNVHVHNEKGERTQSLSNQEFNTHKLPKGHSYNFDEFRSSKVFGKSAKPLKKMIRHLNRQKARGYDTHIVTARSDMDDQPAFAKHLSKYGIQINPNEEGSGHTHVHRTGNLEGSDVGAKKRDTLQGLAQKHGYKKIHMYDDAAKVHKAVQNTPGVEVKTHMVKPRGKSGEVRARSFRATETQQKPINADFEMWVDGLLTEGYDLSNYTWNELAEYFTEAIIAVAAPADEPNNNRPIKKYPPNKPYPFFNFTTNSKKEKSKIKKEEAEMSPYEYWKEFIR